MLITEMLARNARTYPNEIALVERNPTLATRLELTWAEFDCQANQFANALLESGISKGDCVAHLMMNSLEWLPTYFGVLRAGAWIAPLNFRFEADVIDFCIEISRARVLLFGSEFNRRIQSVQPALAESVEVFIYIGSPDTCPEFAIPFDQFVAGASTDVPEVDMELTDDAALYFTSGTTGVPKAVRLTHRNLEHACYVENRHHGQTREDTFLCIPPLYHTGAKMHWFGSFMVGGKGIILKGGVKPDWILEAISEEQATIVWLLVPWAHDILTAYEEGEVNFSKYKLDQWRLMHLGAQPVPPNLIQAWKKLFPHHHYDTNYGLTESTGPGCIHLGLNNTHKIGSIGIPGFDWECRIINDEGNNVADESPGELLVKGPGVMREYYRNPKATEAALRDGWLFTGDIATRDADGFYWLVDRKKDLIITGGENVSPVEVEHFFMDHPAVQDIGVIGSPDKRLGELVAAVIQLKPGMAVTEEQLQVFAEGLPRYKRPRVYFFGGVPRNATGKIEKPKLREKYIS